MVLLDSSEDADSNDAVLYTDAKTHDFRGLRLFTAISLATNCPSKSN